VPAARIGSAPPPRKRNISVTSRSGARSRASCPAPGSSVTVAAGSAAASSRVIWLAHGGLAVPRSKSKHGLPDLAGGAGQVGGGECPGFARQRRSDDGEHVPPAWGVVQRLHLAAGQADDLGKEGEGRAANLAGSHHGADSLGPVVLHLPAVRAARRARCAGTGRRAQLRRARRSRRCCGRLRPLGRPVHRPVRQQRQRHRHIHCSAHNCRRRHSSHGRAGPWRLPAAARSAHPTYAASSG
jgi:hypothetical protein